MATKQIMLTDEQLREKLIEYAKAHPGTNAYDAARDLRLDGWRVADALGDLIDERVLGIYVGGDGDE